MVKYGHKIPFPNDMWDRIKALIEKRSDLGYRSVLEFVLDAVRRRLEELEEKGFFD